MEEEKAKKDKSGILGWAEEDRPREKLLLKGSSALSDAELLAILIRHGRKGETAVDLGRKILKNAGNNLNKLAKLTVKDLTSIAGIGKAKAISVVAAFELSNRRRTSGVVEKEKIAGSKDVFEYFHHLGNLPNEQFWVLFLNRAHKILDKYKVSEGGITGTVADPKIIFKNAIASSATNIILCHNHPSGNLTPSEEDKKLTGKMKEGAKFFDIDVIDHVIISDSGYFSFADEGLL